MSNASLFLRDVKKDPFDFGCASFPSGEDKFLFLMLPLECTLALLSKAERSSTPSFRSHLGDASSPRDLYSYRLACSNELCKAVEADSSSHLGRMAKLAFARHCLGTTYGGQGKNTLLYTVSVCQYYRQNVVKWFDEALQKFQEACDKEENVSFMEVSPFAANFVSYFLGDSYSDVRKVCNTCGDLDKILERYREGRDEVVRQLDGVLLSLTRLQSETMKKGDILVKYAPDSNLSHNALNMYRAVSHTLPYEDIGILLENVKTGSDARIYAGINERYLMETILDSFFLSLEGTGASEALETLIDLRNRMAEFLQRNLQKHYVSLFS